MKKALLSISLLASISAFACPTVTEIYSCADADKKYDDAILTIQSNSKTFKIVSGAFANVKRDALETKMNSKAQKVKGNGVLLYGEPSELLVDTSCKGQTVEVESYYSDPEYRNSVRTNLKLTFAENGERLFFEQAMTDNGKLFHSAACDEFKIMTSFEKARMAAKGGLTYLILLLSGWKGN